MAPGSSRLLRVHGAYVDESEINKIVSHIKIKALNIPVISVSATDKPGEGIVAQVSGPEHSCEATETLGDEEGSPTEILLLSPRGRDRD